MYTLENPHFIYYVQYPFVHFVPPASKGVATTVH